jgi:hypothetical protein
MDVGGVPNDVAFTSCDTFRVSHDSGYAPCKTGCCEVNSLMLQGMNLLLAVGAGRALALMYVPATQCLRDLAGIVP